MGIRSYHKTLSVAMGEARKWKNRGFRVHVERPQRKTRKGNFRIVTEGRGSKKLKGHIYLTYKHQKAP